MENREIEVMNPLFKSHILTEDGILKAKGLALRFERFYDELHDVIFSAVQSDQPGWEGREWSIVKTKLEEASFYAKKCLAQKNEKTEG